MKFDKFSDKVLILILEEMNQKIDDDDMDLDLYPYDYDNLNGICDILKYFGVKLDESDLLELSYFVSLWKLNPNYNTHPIVRPKLKNFDVISKETRIETTETYYKSVMPFYDDLEYNYSVVYDLQSSGEYDYWDGEVIKEEVVNSQIIDSEIDSITNN
jgi:hypothetical protein